MSFGLYVHYPYCLQQCSYCDFATDLYKNEEKNQDYLSLLKKELELGSEAFENKKLATIYFGGGTPSLLKTQDFVNFFQHLNKCGFTWDKKTEITLEINPSSVNLDKLKELKSIGINRFSLGTQTFNTQLLKKVGRLHNAKDSMQNMEELNRLDLNFSCDLLFSLPHQTMKDLEGDLKILMKYQPQHISPYILTLPAKHPLQVGRPRDSIQVEMMGLIREQLSYHGYNQYEISNYAKPGYFSRHNYNAWRGHPYWGIGMSAHSYLDKPNWGVRFHNPPHTKAYAKQIESRKKGLPYLDLKENQKEYLKINEAISDFCHTSLRLREGLDFSIAEKRFGNAILDQIKQRLNSPKLEPYIEKTTKGAKLSWSGILFSNLVFEEMLFLRDDIRVP